MMFINVSKNVLGLEIMHIMKLDNDTLQRLYDVFTIESDCIRDMRAFFDENAFAHAVRLLMSAERIGTSGCGHSGIVCQHLAHLLCCIERPARFISPADALHGAMGFLKTGDVMILASRGGKTAELLPMLDVCKKKGIFVIVITANTSSILAKGADVVIKQYVNRETDRDNAQGTTSTTSLYVLCHLLQTALIEVTGYSKQQFAVNHPGGAVGERLNKKDEASAMKGTD